MHPYIAQAIAADRAADMRREAEAIHRARIAATAKGSRTPRGASRPTVGGGPRVAAQVPPQRAAAAAAATASASRVPVMAHSATAVSSQSDHSDLAYLGETDEKSDPRAFCSVAR